jgi:hypothetical protein
MSRQTMSSRHDLCRGWLIKALLICLSLTLIPGLLEAQTPTGRGSGRRPSGATPPATSAPRTNAQPDDAATCGALPQRYREREYGSTLHALEVSCRRALTPEEQVFMGGLAQGLLQTCAFPADPRRREKLSTFLTSSGLVAAFGRDFSSLRLRDGVVSQVVAATAYAAGEGASQWAGCTPLGALLAEGVVAYLDRISTTSNRFVQGCARYYQGRYTAAQCQCLADVFRAVEPDVYSQEFTRDVFPYISQRNPFVGLQAAMQCGIVSY